MLTIHPYQQARNGMRNTERKTLNKEKRITRMKREMVQIREKLHISPAEEILKGLHQIN